MDESATSHPHTEVEAQRAVEGRKQDMGKCNKKDPRPGKSSKWAGILLLQFLSDFNDYLLLLLCVCVFTVCEGGMYVPGHTDRGQMTIVE